MILAMLSGLLSRVIFNSFSVFWKDLRHKGLDAYGILAFSFMTACYWPVVALVLYFTGNGVVTWDYIGLVSGQAISFLLYNIAIITLFKFQSLTVADAFRGVFTTAVAVFVDLYFFKISFDTQTIIGGALMLFAGIALQLDRKKNIDFDHMPILSVLGVSALVGILSAMDVSFYKAGLEYQDNMIFHLAWVNMSIMPFALILGLKSLKKANKDHLLRPKHYMIVGGLHLIAMLTYTYAIDIVSVTVMSLIRIAGIAIFVFADIKFKEFFHHPKTYLCIGIIFLGLVLITFNSL